MSGIPDIESISEMLQGRVKQPTREEMLEGQRLSALFMRAAFASDSGTDVSVRHLLDMMDDWTSFVNDSEDMEVEPIINREIGKFMRAGGEMLSAISELGAFRMGMDPQTWQAEQLERERQERVASYGHVGDDADSAIREDVASEDEVLASDEAQG